jgi:hypothetical protein
MGNNDNLVNHNINNIVSKIFELNINGDKIISNDKNNKKIISKKNKTMLSLNDINDLLDIHIEYIDKLKKFKNKTNCSLRFPNFPECISENIIKEYINIIEKRKCISSTNSGDLEVIDNLKKIKIEVKCFTSTCPSSFGPNEKWDEIYFLDAKNFANKKFKIYKLNLSNVSNEFKLIKINSEKTYEQVCKEGKRPRLSFKILKEQLKNNVNLVYEGSTNFS